MLTALFIDLFIIIVVLYFVWTGRNRICEMFSTPTPTRPEVHVINLDRSVDRKRNVENSAKKNNITINFFSAIDGYQHKLTNVERNFFRGSDFRIEKKGVVGCALSHYYLWKDLLRSNDEWFIICEDDVVFNSGFNTNLDILLRQAKQNNYDVIFAYSSERENIRKITRLDSSRWFGGGASCYLINRNALEYLTQSIENGGITGAIDWYIYDQCHDISIGYLSSPIVHLDDELSQKTTITNH